MFKIKGKTRNFVKQQVAKMMSVIMLATTFLSSGMAISTAYGASNPKMSYGQELLDELANIAASGTKYVYGGFSETGVDCRRYVWLGLRHVFGTEVGYWVDNDGNAVLDANGQKQTVKLPPEKDAEINQLTNVPSGATKICIEGNGLRSYYKVYVAGTVNGVKNAGLGALDISYNGNTYSSVIAEACQYPGSIIVHNGHVGVGLGEYHSAADVLADYPNLNQKSTGTSGNNMVVFNDGAYRTGNNYSSSDSRYWFGKTAYLSASSTKYGLYANNYTSQGKTVPNGNSELVILVCESEPQTTTLQFEKVDSATGDRLGGAKYGLYSDKECTDLVVKFSTIENGYTEVQVKKGMYYAKELVNPNGYELSTTVIPVDATGGGTKSIKLSDNPVNATVLIQKVDACDNSVPLKETVLEIYEYDAEKEAFGEKALVQLKYNDDVEGFIIDGPYTNNMGITYTDNTLHYTTRNLGRMKVKEITAQNGYENSGYEEIFDISQESIILTGNTAIQNKARTSLYIKKVDEDGNPIEGVTFRFMYNGEDRYATTDEDGIAYFDNLYSWFSRTGTLFETEAPKGYVIPTEYQLGKKIALNCESNDLTVNEKGEYEFRTNLTIVNSTEEIEEVGTGTIKFQKIDKSDLFFSPVPNTEYTIYTDAQCTTVATDNDGKLLSGLLTDENGWVEVTNLAFDLYYIRETKAPNGYAIQNKTFAVNLFKENPSVIFNSETGSYELNSIKGVGDYRQVVELNLCKKDEVTGKGVEGAVFALYNSSDLLTETMGLTVTPRLLGYYATDENGMIHATTFGSEKFKLNGRTYDAVNLEIDGEEINGECLTNGTYYFVEVAAADGYYHVTSNTETRYTLDATWANNSTGEDIVLDNGTTITAYGKKAIPSTINCTNKRQTVVIELQKTDSEKDNVNDYYALDDYQSAVDKGMAATLQGAKYQLYNDTDIVDVTTGDVIAANTLLGIYTTDQNGHIRISELQYDIYSGNPIPNGTYHLVESEAPLGYIINLDPIKVDASWSLNQSDESFLKIEKEHEEDILCQDITIKKVSSKDETKVLSGASFQIYSAAKYEEFTGSEIPFIETSSEVNGFKAVDRDVFLAKVSEYNVPFEYGDSADGIFTTNESGLAQVGKLVYGDYIIIETVSPDEYELTDGVYLQVPLVKEEIADGIVYLHNVNQKPTEGYTQTVADTLIETTVTIAKYEEVSGKKVSVEGATLQLLDSDGNVVVLEDGTVCEWVTKSTSNTLNEDGLPVHVIKGLTSGSYIIHEKEAPEGYATAKNVTIKVRGIEEIQSFGIKNDAIKVSVDKVDATSGKSITGAVLAIYDENDKIVLDKNNNELKWTTDGSAHVITHIPVGTYYVRELTTPEGYATAAEIKLVVSDSNAVQSIIVQDERTQGKFTIIKTDAKTGEPLANVEFEVRSAEEVIDPITKEVIFEKDEVVGTIKTDENGEGTTSELLPVGVYDETGELTLIRYNIVETKTPSGQYEPETVEDAVLDSTSGLTEVESVINIGNKNPIVSVTKTGTPDTFVGKYEEKDNVTVVKNGDELTYTITVKNSGDASAYNVVVKDEIPENTEFIASSLANTHNAVYDETTNCIYWDIEEIPAGGTVELKFTVTVTEDEACEIVNIAKYAMPDYIPTDANRLSPTDDLDWSETDAVVHQVVEFHKTSTIVGGNTKDDATAVSDGDTIKYHMTFKTTNDVYGVVVLDVIDKNLTYVKGSATINGTKDNGVSYNPDTRKLTFSNTDVTAGETKFEFEVTVNKAPVGTRMDYQNVATVEFNVNGEDGQTDKIDSEVVTHFCEKSYYVEKHGTPLTYEGNATEATNVTVLQKGEEIEYSILVVNDGKSIVRNIVVCDTVPDGLKYVENTTPDGVTVWEDKNGETLTWYINQLDTNESVTLKFKATVEEQKAQFIVNSATYGIMDVEGEDVPVLPSDSKKTNDVVHQVVEFHKTSEVVGGTNEDDATPVTIGDTITYTLKVITKGKLTNVVISDEIPDGLEFVGNVAMKSSEDTEWTDLEDDAVISGEDGSGKAIFDIDEINAGTYYFKFDVKVKHIPVNTEKFFINQAVMEYDRMPNKEETKRDSLLSEEVSHITSYKISGVKTGKVETYVGDYESRNHVTVVKNGEEIVYTISVTNVGVSALNGLVIKDTIPEYTTFVKAENNGEFDEDTKTVNWIIDTVKANETVSVSFTVKCEVDNKAVEIRNKAAYAVPEDLDDIKDEEWLWTDEVIHQTVALHKTATIDYGTTEEDAKYVEIGSMFTYKLTFEALNPVYGLTVEDYIPSGLRFIKDTATYTLEGTEAVKINDLAVNENNKLAFPTIEEVPAGTTEFAFDVKVQDVKNYDEVYYFINVATATVLTNEDSENTVDLVSETVSNKTIKGTEEPVKPQTGDSISPIIGWSLVAIISAIAMVFFGAYGFADKKRK